MVPFLAKPANSEEFFIRNIMMVVCNVFLILLVLFGGTASRELTDEEYHRLPDLFYLDNYEKCLTYDDGVYCLGTFHLTPLQEPHAVYDLMKEYSEETYAFNHTLMHRGYCINSRCPKLNSTFTLSNITQLTSLFEQCAIEQAKKGGFQANLTALKYCRTRADMQRYEPPSLTQIIFLAVVIFLILMNVVGTAYDIKTRDNSKRKKILLAWSAIKNWKLLTSYEDKGKSALTALHGIRVCVAISTCLSHSALLYYSLYLYKPRALEIVSSHPLSMFLQNSTGSEQMFVVISGFLYAYQLRVFMETHRVVSSYKLLPILIAKRIIRLSPVFFLVVGFAATWWPALGSGPIWTATVGAESEICKEKFWAHLLFINNLVQAEKHCVLPTWYMAVDVQMHILSTFVMVLLLQFPKRMLLLLGLLFGASCALNAVLVYIFDWIPMLYLTVSPENLRTLFRDVPSYAGLYISPWGSISACFLGLILGHLYYDMKDGDLIIGKYKWLLNMSCLVSVPMLCTWVLLGYFLQHVKAKAFMVAYAALERSIFQILCLLSYVVFSVISGFVLKLLAWRGWLALSRMSLSVMTVHWLVNLYLVGSAPLLMATSVMDIGIYGISTAVYTFLFAVPITILVEMPMKKFFDIVTS